MDELQKVVSKESQTEVVPLKILLVDDNVDNRNLVIAYLKKTPHSIETAENGLEAIEKYIAGYGWAHCNKKIRAWEKRALKGKNRYCSIFGSCSKRT